MLRDHDWISAGGEKLRRQCHKEGLSDTARITVSSHEPSKAMNENGQKGCLRHLRSVKTVLYSAGDEEEPRRKLTGASALRP